MADNIKEEKKEVDETTIQEASTEEENEGVEITEESDPTAPEDNTADESEIDYKAEYEKVKAAKEVISNRLNKAEHKIVELKKESNDDLDGEIVEEDPYGVQDIVKQEVERITNSLREDIVGDVIEEELNSLSKNEDEKKLIKYHYDNSIRPSGTNRKSIQQDLKSAYLLANQKKFLKENEELKATIKSKATRSKGENDSNQDPLKAKVIPVKLSAADIAFCKKRGIDPSKIEFNI